MKKTIVPIIVAFLFLGGCAGTDGANKLVTGLEGGGPDIGDNPFFQPAPAAGQEPDEGSAEGPASSKVSPVGLKNAGLNGKFECGQEISGHIAATGGAADFTWDVVDLPSWLSATPSGQRNEMLQISGTVPYEICDEEKIEAKVSACSGDQNCKDIPLTIKTKIPVVKLTGDLPDRTIVLGDEAILNLKVTGASGVYDVDVFVNDADVPATSCQEVACDNVSISLPHVGIHDVRVVVKDRQLNARRTALQEKYGEDNSKLAQDEGVFKVTVQENGGFLLAGRVLDADNTTIATAAGNESLVVPYDGKFQVWVASAAGPEEASYALSLPSDSSLQFIDDSGGSLGTSASALEAMAMLTIVVAYPGVQEKGLVLEDVKITAENAVGDIKELVIPSITFMGEPCQTLSAAKIEILQPTKDGNYTTLNINKPIDLINIPPEGVNYKFRINGAGSSKLVWSFFSVSTPIDSSIDVIDKGNVKYNETLLNRYFPDKGQDSEEHKVVFDGSVYVEILRSSWDTDRWTNKGNCSGTECTLHNSFLYDVYAYSDYNNGANLTTSEKQDDELNTPAQFFENLVVGVKSEQCETASYQIIPLIIQIPSPSSETFGPSSTASLKYHASAYTTGDDDTSFELEMKDSGDEEALACLDGNLQQTDSGEDKTYGSDKFEYNDLCTGKPIIESINQLHIYVDDVGGDWCGAGGTGVEITAKKIMINGKYWTITYEPAGAKVCASHSGSDSGDFTIGNPTATLRRDDDD